MGKNGNVLPESASSHGFIPFSLGGFLFIFFLSWLFQVLVLNVVELVYVVCRRDRIFS